MDILIVDDNEVVRRQLFWALRRGNALHEAAGRAEARAILAGLQPDVILLELLEEGDADETPGVALVEELLGVADPAIILIITRSNRKDVAARLLRLGVLDIFSKPLNLEELPIVLKRAERLQGISLAGNEAATGPGTGRDEGATAEPRAEPNLDIVGVDPRIKQILEQIRRIAPTPVSVLITGETGTGKERFAQAVHKLSDRRDCRFVPLNCAVLTDTLVEDELFGHEKGAFTGAIERRKGKFEYAHKGTLFLDEIGDISPVLQSKFLRVVQERQFERLGGNQPINTDFRLICATHRDIFRMTKEGTFRDDLLFRINVVSFKIPPLRERRGDIKLLAKIFLQQYTQEFGRTEEMSFSREVVRFMFDYHWPGNVRELKHFVERAVALNEGRVIGPEALPEDLQAVPEGESLAANGGNFDTLVKRYKRQLVMEALQMAGNNKVQTAQMLGLSRSYLFKLIKQLAVPN